MWPPESPLLGTDHVLPAAMGEKAMVSARGQLGSIPQGDAERRLDARPVSQDARQGEAPIGTVALRPIDSVPDLNIGQWLRTTIGHEDQGVASQAVGTGVGASPVGVDRPAERHLRLVWHTVENRARPDLIETGLK